jgi:hypothetical protein
MVLYILIFMFLDSRLEDKRFIDWMVASITQIQFPPESNFDLLLKKK